MKCRVFFVAYLKKVAFTGNRDVYFVFTSGGYAGISSIQGKWLARRKKLRYMGRAEVQMPRNYISSDWFDELEKEEIERRIREAVGRLPSIASAIQAGEKLKDRHVWLFESIITLPFNPVWSRIVHKTKDFYVTEACISCGKCEGCCPMNAIEMREGKPVWIKKSCAHCMACIQNCPANSIEYGQITQKKPRYYFDKYKGAARTG